uniref:Uncharacterized protein n=1 Tax=Brassica oleracea TaxID=3712 RepID=A0A3P6D208_BRAOL|nr:unnamed protein product [Brassica oleracea]
MLLTEAELDKNLIQKKLEQQLEQECIHRTCSCCIVLHRWSSSCSLCLLLC